ncbi:MAG: hypothetical protein ABJN34_04805 [Litoreibacter sp.]|uniref:hypothetical protein n=1 Tax=Litoreibacter sp. TaxID=1969459 RepID=UPI00329784A5
MTSFQLPKAPLLLAAVIMFGTVGAANADDPVVIDPTTGEYVSVNALAFSDLTDDERREVGGQLAEQGYSARSSSEAVEIDTSEVTVTDPSTGESTTLDTVDVSSLSSVERQELGDELAEQGVGHGSNPAPEGSGQGGNRGGGGRGRE